MSDLDNKLECSFPNENTRKVLLEKYILVGYQNWPIKYPKYVHLDFTYKIIEELNYNFILNEDFELTYKGKIIKEDIIF